MIATTQTTCKPHPDCDMCKGNGVDKPPLRYRVTYGGGQVVFEHCILGHGIFMCEAQCEAPK